MLIDLSSLIRSKVLVLVSRETIRFTERGTWGSSSQGRKDMS